jgi:hypothetical protein
MDDMITLAVTSSYYSEPVRYALSAPSRPFPTPIGGGAQEFSIDFPKQSHPYSIRNECIKTKRRYLWRSEESQKIADEVQV